MTAASGFLGRWSRRKAGIDELSQVEPLPTMPPATAAPLLPVASETGVAPEAEIPLPSMADVAALTRESDFAPFVRAGVAPGVRNAAMKKLFSDPHFNIMDGLDTYIDDYGKPDPIPPSMLRLMNQAATLGLFDEEDDDKAAAAALACPDGSPATQLAQSLATPPDPDLDPRPDDDPDLRLQQDDAAGRPGAGPGPRA